MLSPGDAATLKAKLADAFIMRSVPVVHEGSIAIACGYEGITDFPPLEAIDHPIARLAHWA